MKKINSFGRISALILRYLYLLRSSWPRIIEIAYWPTMQMVIWGFVSQHFSGSSPELTAGGILISVVLVWDCLFRSHISYTLSFLEELWSRNLGNLFVSPLRPAELIAALASISMMRTLIGMLPAALLAIPFFEVSVFEMGFPLLGFFLNLGNFSICNWNTYTLWVGSRELNLGSSVLNCPIFLYLLSACHPS